MGASTGLFAWRPDLQLPTPTPWVLFGIYGSGVLLLGAFFLRRRPGEAFLPRQRPISIATLALCAPALLASPSGLPPA